MNRQTPGGLRFVFAACLALALGVACPLTSGAQETRCFDQTTSLGNHPTKELGTPKVIDAPMGKAVAFNGVNEALFVDKRPSKAGLDQVMLLIFTAAYAGPA